MICGIACFSISQDNTLPTSGNIGVGTLNPTVKLDVKGNMKIDSSLVIKDSLTVNKTIRVMDKVFIGGKTVMNENAVVKQNFKVMGNANFDGNATVDGNLKLPNINTLSNNNISQGNFDFLLLNENGAARKGSYADLIEKAGDAIYTIDNGKQCLEGPISNPKWVSGENKIVVNCPQIFVGISTTEPRFPLEVNGTGYFKRGLRLGDYEDIQTYIPAYIEGNTVSVNNTRDWIRLKTTYNNAVSTVFLVNNEGGLYCTSARVRLKEDIPVPDFVFKPDYELMPLSEVKQFVQTNAHLPNIPSEKEIREEGLSLDEMQLKLLQKVEELTLYIIELDEKNKALEAEVEALKKK